MSRWRCRWYRRRLVDYADEVLPHRQQQCVEAHLSLCPTCGEGVAALREVPAALLAAAVPERGEEFWRQQREAIGNAVRNARVPCASWRPAWWSHGGWRLGWWRYPLAAAASALVALAVYHFAASSPVTAPGALEEEEFAALDTESLLSLRELMQTLVPADEQIAEAGADDDVLLAALPLSDFTGTADVYETPQANDLSDGELEGLNTLVGDLG
jgi:anti-sigma factor RsiW